MSDIKDPAVAVEAVIAAMPVDYYAVADLRGDDMLDFAAAFIRPLGATEDEMQSFGEDVRDIVNGSAIEVGHEIAGHVVAAEIVDDDLQIEIDGRLVAVYAIGDAA